MPLQQILAPRTEPISLVEAKTQCRVLASDTSEDALLTALIAASRAYAQTRTNRQVIASRYKLILDSFPGPSLMGVPAGQAYTLPRHAILIPLCPVLQVVSITYTAMDGTTQTMPTSDYVSVVVDDVTRITPVFGKIWPIPLPQIGAVQVTFDAGHAALATADAAADTLTAAAWKTLAVNDTLRVQVRDKTTLADGVLPAPLAGYTDYYVRSAPGNGVYTLSASSGGSLIDLTTVGTGDLFVGELPQGLIAWMKLAVGTLYENRESIAIDQRINLVELPSDFLDGLLDPYRLPLY